MFPLGKFRDYLHEGMALSMLCAESQTCSQLIAHRFLLIAHRWRASRLVLAVKEGKREYGTGKSAVFYCQISLSHLV